METKAGITVDYIPPSDILESPMDIREVEDLEKLGERVDHFVRSEKARLKIERQFLKSVIDASSYGKYAEKDKWIKQINVVEDVKKLLGISKK
jgi:hypothetical protein